MSKPGSASVRKAMLLMLLLGSALHLACPGETSEHSAPPRAVTPLVERANAESAQVASPIEGRGVYPRRVTLESFADETAESLRRGYDISEAELRAAGFGHVVDEIKTLDGVQLHDIEAESLTREVVRRAEAHTPRQGERVLARLYQVAAERFPAVAQDPAPHYEHLRNVIAQNPPAAFRPENFKFGPAVEGSTVKLSAPVERAVRELAYVYSRGDISELSRIATRAFAGKVSFSEHLAKASTTRGALLSALAAHGPPPPVEAVVRDMMVQTSRYPAVSQNTEFQKALIELKPEAIGFDANRDAVHQSLARQQDGLPSRVAQYEQARTIQMEGNVPKRGLAETITVVTQMPTEGRVEGRAGISLQEGAQQYSNYVSNSFEASSAIDPSERHVGGGGGGGGGGGASADRGRGSSRPAYRILGPQSGNSVPVGSTSRVPRTFSKAIFSARAARGIAVGADLTAPRSVTLKNIGWVPNPKDDRFGRIVAQVEGGSKLYLASSRTLFADSFEAALDILWGGHYGSTAFRKGEILVLMSMDPFSRPDPEGADALEAEARALRSQAERLREDDERGQMTVLLEIMKLQARAAELPRRIVLHPSLHGRELAWSAARVDFWFNDLDGLSKESAKVNGGKTMPPALQAIELKQASTWQFYERAKSIRVAPGGSGGLGALTVDSSGEPGIRSARSHYSVSMFRLGEEDDDGIRLPSLEKQVQPMLDWLAVNHHDFLRLNDFSEALTLLRWAHDAGVRPLLLNMNGESPGIATPDRVVIGEGPKVR